MLYRDKYSILKIQQEIKTKYGRDISYIPIYNYLCRNYLNFIDEQKKRKDIRMEKHRENSRKLGEIIKEELEKLGKNQSQLAKELDIERQAVSVYINGRSMPTGKRAEKLCEVLNLDQKYLRKTYGIEFHPGYRFK